MLEVLVNCLFKLSQEKNKSTDRPAMTIAVDLGRKVTKQTNKQTNSPILNFPIISTTIVTISDSQHGVVGVLGIAVRVIIDSSTVRPEMYTIIIKRGSYMSAHVLLNLSNELGKSD